MVLCRKRGQLTLMTRVTWAVSQAFARPKRFIRHENASINSTSTSSQMRSGRKFVELIEAKVDCSETVGLLPVPMTFAFRSHKRSFSVRFQAKVSRFTCSRAVIRQAGATGSLGAGKNTNWEHTRSHVRDMTAQTQNAYAEL